MSSILLSPEISVELFLEFLLLFVLSFTLLQAIYILKYYKKGTTTELQYSLEKKSYLVGVVIGISLIIKIVLVAFFAYSLDELSVIVPGAMCAAGVVSSNLYGEPLLLLKLLILLLASLWLLLNRADVHVADAPYFKKKLYLFIVLYILILLEFFTSVNFLTLIETQNPVLCCSVIYTDSSNPIPFNMSNFQLITLFYMLYFVVFLSAIYKNKKLLFISSILFVYISYYALVYFFSTYIYELPTHKCPFCMLQKEYYYVGYFIYSALFLAIFYTSGFMLFKFMNYAYKRLILFFTLFVLILSSYFLIYIISNGVLL